jgi:predicted transcriptional regulator
MEMPYYLKTLPPEALDIIRFYSGLGDPFAYADEITARTGLSDISFGKAIRRLVTKGFVAMDGDRRYRLTERGARAVEELIEFDAHAPLPSQNDGRGAAQVVYRRLVLALPQPLVAGRETEVVVGFHPADDSAWVNIPADLLLRLTILNGEPGRALEVPLVLGNQHARHPFRVTAGQFTRVRLRLQVYQIGDDPDEVQSAGGMYVDVDVVPDAVSAVMTAYGTDARIVIAE